jgi:hypothetical protein
MTIWVDGDRTPKDAREIVHRAGERLGIAVRPLLPDRVEPGDVVVTGDEALGRDLAGRGIAALDPRGEEFVPAAHAEAPEARELLDSIRALTVGGRGSPPYDERARRKFAAALDRILTRQTWR